MAKHPSSTPPPLPAAPLGFWARRRFRRRAAHLLRDLRHIRNMREDVAPADDLDRLRALEDKVRDARQRADPAAFAAATERLDQTLARVCPPRRWPWLRDHAEMIVVALTVALAFRAYVVQPYKIPTSSMAPTLYGIHYTPQDRPGLFDRWPLNLLRWAVFGDWYVEVRAPLAGVVDARDLSSNRVFGARAAMAVDRVVCPVEPGMKAHAAPGDRVVRGQLLASGIRTLGDHIFVNKVIWHYRKPVRGEIMVFRTRGITHPAMTHPNETYVKRLVGLPGETISIEPPNLLINGEPVRTPGTLARIADRAPGYAGYLLPSQPSAHLVQHGNRVALSADQFYACGDNQPNSADSRSWGPVPRENLVGPTFFVYWPFGPHWGPAR
jgi:signal peptidase I